MAPDGKKGENWTPEKSTWLLERAPGKEEGAAQNPTFPGF